MEESTPSSQGFFSGPTTHPQPISKLCVLLGHPTSSLHLYDAPDTASPSLHTLAFLKGSTYTHELGNSMGWV